MNNNDNTQKTQNNQNSSQNSHQTSKQNSKQNTTTEPPRKAARARNQPKLRPDLFPPGIKNHRASYQRTLHELQGLSLSDVQLKTSKNLRKNTKTSNTRAKSDEIASNSEKSHKSQFSSNSHTPSPKNSGSGRSAELLSSKTNNFPPLPGQTNQNKTKDSNMRNGRSNTGNGNIGNGNQGFQGISIPPPNINHSILPITTQYQQALNQHQNSMAQNMNTQAAILTHQARQLTEASRLAPQNGKPNNSNSFSSIPTAAATPIAAEPPRAIPHTVLPTSSINQFGITNPISVEKPQNRDLLLTAELKKALKPYGVFDTEEGLQHRIRILTKLNEMVKRFVQTVRSKKDQSQDITKISGKIYTFGSYRLGVHTQGADIDTLCVVPIGVERGDFFSEFYDMLKRADGVEDVRAIENAFVPVIKLYRKGRNY